MKNTTTNTGAASLSDRLIDDTSPQADAAPSESEICAIGAAASLCESVGNDVIAKHIRDYLARRSAPSSAVQADAAPSLPRYTEWLHLRTHGQWSDGVPEWARDHDGRMNDVTAANAVIGELADAAIAAGGAQETAAARDALAERQRQVAVEGFAPEQDDRYQDGSLAGAAICYALTVFGAEEIPNYYWPRTWSASWWKPTTPRRNLVKAAALILAEIERIDRAAPGTCFFCSEPMNSAHESDCPQAPTAASNGAPK